MTISIIPKELSFGICLYNIMNSLKIYVINLQICNKTFFVGSFMFFQYDIKVMKFLVANCITSSHVLIVNKINHINLIIMENLYHQNIFSILNQVDGLEQKEIGLNTCNTFNNPT